MKKVLFLKNTLILTGSSLILRLIGIVFKVWLAGKIGSEGIGVYQLVFSVYMLAATFASGGITTTLTRLITNELALGCMRGVKKIMRRAFFITAAAALISCVVILLLADPIAVFAIKNDEAALSLKILTVSLPFMGFSACIRGYFTARRKALPGAAAQIFEQLVRIGAIMVILYVVPIQSPTLACAAVILGDSIAEIASLLLLALVFRSDTKNIAYLRGRASPPYNINKEILRITLPITGGRYLNTALRTVENMLVPLGLCTFGLSSEAALSSFGMIKGMALPVLFFPSSLLGAVSTLLIPEICEAKAKNQDKIALKATQRVLKITSLCGFLFGAFFSVCGRQIGVVIYNDSAVGELICILAPLVPLMYLDSVCDGILKGLDQQVFTFRNSVIDSSLRLILVLIFVPRFGMQGFIGIMYFSNLLTALLNIGRLLFVSGAKLTPWGDVILPILFAAAGCFAGAALLKNTALPAIVYCGAMLIIGVLIYVLLLTLSGIIKLKNLKTFFR